MREVDKGGGYRGGYAAGRVARPVITLVPVQESSRRESLLFLLCSSSDRKRYSNAPKESAATAISVGLATLTAAAHLAR
jgi:hypothetical protein